MALAMMTALAPAARSNDIDSLAGAIASHSPKVRTAALDLRAEGQRTLAENALPDPVVEFEHLWGGGETRLTASVSQEVSLPGVYSARRATAAAYDTLARATVRAAWLETRQEACEALLRAAWCRERMLLAEREMAWLDTLGASGERAYRGGQINILDFNKLRIERLRRQAELEQMQAEWLGAIDEVCSLAPDLDVHSAVVAVTLPDMSPLPPLDTVLASTRRDPAAAALMAEKGVLQARGRQIGRERLPQMSLSYIFNREEGVNYNGFNIGMSLPLWRRSAERKALALEQEALDCRLEALPRGQAHTLEGDYDSALQLQRYISLYRPLVEDPEVARVLDVAMEARSITLLDYLQERAWLTDASLELIDLRYRYALLAASVTRFL